MPDRLISKLFYSAVVTLFALVMAYGCTTTEPAAPQLPQEEEPRTPLPYPAPDKPEKELQPKADVDIDSLIQNMSLREKIGQLFVIPANGRFMNDNDPRFLEWKRLITEYHIGGVIFMRGNLYGQAVMTRQFQQLASVPLWISQDMEFGAAMRVEGTTRFTPAMGIAASGTAENAFIKGQVTAREAKALGVHQIFAPVLDVNNNPDNPVINVRSFSSDPEIVTTFGDAFIRGVESEGILATAKHFPGHGDTDVDSHLALPVIQHNYHRLDSLELVPFRHVIQNGIRSIMTAHIAFPNISSRPDLPGTLDPDILTGILADSLGFNGLVVTDGLEMQGITSRFSPGRAAVRALEAGVDLMVISPDEKTAIYEMEKAVERGQLTEQRIDRSVRKILSLKKEAGLFKDPKPDIEALSQLIHPPAYASHSDRIARESVTLLKNEGEILPVREADFQRIVVISVADDKSGTTGEQLAREMRKYHSNVSFHILDQRTGAEEKEKMVEEARAADLIVVGSFIYVRSHQPMQLTSDQRALLMELELADRPIILASFGNPYVIQELERADVHLLAWSASSQQIRNTVPALFGGAPIQGRLPVSIPGLYDLGNGLEIPHNALRFDRSEAIGMNRDSLMAVDRIMQSAVEDSVFPGGSVAVVKDGVIAWHEGYGYHDYDKTEPVRANDIYDLASLTKVVATTTSIMKLYDEEKIGLDDPVADYIPEFRAPVRDEITIRHLLLHTSGLPAFQIYVDELRTRHELLDAIRNEPLENSPGETYVYSDLGFILLAEIVEKVSGERLDRFAHNYVYRSLGMRSTRFNPTNAGNWILRRIPPTEIDTVYDRGKVHGNVHDERAYYMDGVSGHAGLFASSADLAIWAQMLLNGGNFAGKQYLKPETIELFTGHRSPVNHRGYGFDRKSGERSTAGALTGDNTFGHLGFTGTSIWIDPDENIAIILLTNRTWPDRSYGAEISSIRRQIADAVMRSIERKEKGR